MATLFEGNWVVDLGLDLCSPQDFYASSDDVERYASRLRVPALLSAWNDLKLSGIFCKAGIPQAFFKESLSEDVNIKQTHLELWNKCGAPLLVIISQSTITVLSALALPKRSARGNLGKLLVDALDRVTDALQIKTLVDAFESGEYYRRRSEHFQPRHRVDRHLLRNLGAALKGLETPDDGISLSSSTAQALLGRTVFCCYLIDRNIITSEYFSRCGAQGCSSLLHIISLSDKVEAKRLLYSLFYSLKADFNGDLFTGDLQAEASSIRPNHIVILERLLSGDDIRTGQQSLGFNVYDFESIPIEAISAIYESFLDALDETGKRRDGAFYTPRLLAEMLLETATESETSILDKSFLDPACGSGIFLVSLFQRMAFEWAKRNPLASLEEKFQGLTTILSGNLCGVDKNPTACRIAAFSLYLALLDQFKPPDILALQAQGMRLPALAVDAADGVASTLIRANFLSDTLPIRTNHFDFVVGNPPWGENKDVDRSKFGLTDEETANFQIANDFLISAPTYLRPGGKACLLIPAQTLFNQGSHAENFRKRWIQQFAVKKLINLSDMSFLLFEDADRPACIALYENRAPNKHLHTITFASPKVEPELMRAEIVEVSPLDLKSISQRDLLSSNCGIGTTLKTYMWASDRDLRLIAKLRTYPPLSDLAKAPDDASARWVKGQGYKPDRPNLAAAKKHSLKERPHDDRLFLPSTHPSLLNLILQPDVLDPIGNEHKLLERLPNDRLFQAPLVIFNQGFSKFLFSDHDLWFRHALQSIAGPTDDKALLQFLAAVMDSPLARYYLFHTSCNWGTERDKSLLLEALRLPFPLPQDTLNPQVAFEIVSQVSHLFSEASGRILGDHSPSVTSSDLRERVLPLILEYYNLTLTERILIEDTTSLWEKSSTPSSRDIESVPALRTVSRADRDDYTSTLMATLNRWTTPRAPRLSVDRIVSQASGMGVLIVDRQGRGSGLEFDAEEVLSQSLAKVRTFVRTSGSHISYRRDLKLFVGDDLYILKPLRLRYWARSRALSDADEIASAALFEQGRNQLTT